MFWDVFIAIGIGFSQLALTWYGVHVSVEKHRIRNALIIGVVGLAGISLTVFGAIRNSAVQQALQTQLTQIQKNTEQPPVINFPPPPPRHSRLAFEHTDVTGHPLLPLHKGEPPSINIKYWNVGNFTVSGNRQAGMVVTVPLEDVPHVFRKYRGGLSLSPAAGVLNPTGYLYGTYSGLPLTDEDIRKINNREKAICGVGLVDWEDETGSYETDFSQCLVAESDGVFNWHMSEMNNVEHKRGAKK
jgi:hypothetical protein